MSNKRRHHDRKSIRKRLQKQRKLNVQAEQFGLRTRAKNIVAKALSEGGMTALRQLATELGVPFLRVYGEPVKNGGLSPGSVGVEKLSKRVIHKFIEQFRRG